ncbi:MAG: magnesium transporter [Hyphomicrobiaceae bacterium]|jgi:magnesium transporter
MNEPIELPGLRVRARCFDFENKKEHAPTLDEIRQCPPNSFLWIDAEITNRDSCAQSLASLNLTEAIPSLEDLAEDGVRTRYRRSEEHIAFTLAGCHIDNGQLLVEPVAALLNHRHLVTLHGESVGFLDAVNEDVSDDFQQFAKGPSFLVYELWDHLIENFVAIQAKLQDSVEELQTELIGRTDEGAFLRVAEIGADLLAFRKMLIPVRDALAELAARKSSFISEETRPFLAAMTGSVDRVISDVLVDRELLSESLNLHMSMVTHRTNQIMNRLTVVSIIFLPLTFLCGIYGMNFEVMPELQWQYGYPTFWVAACVLTAALLAIMRRNRLL